MFGLVAATLAMSGADAETEAIADAVMVVAGGGGVVTDVLMVVNGRVALGVVAGTEAGIIPGTMTEALAGTVFVVQNWVGLDHVVT